jgi:hypothetical protein
MGINKLNVIRDLAVLGLSFILCAIVVICVISDNNAKAEQHKEDFIREQTILRMEHIKTRIVDEIYYYLYSVAPTCEVDADILFDMCNKYNVDVRFAMAQAQVESHYATKGTAKKTKSMFNVGAYDGHSAKRQIRNGFGFDDVNDSIEPYLQLITSEYLIDNKTTNDLLYNYVNHLGMRYATNPRYEKMLRSVYNRINNTTDLDVLIIEYNEYKEIIG